MNFQLHVSNSSAQYLEITEDNADQRLDNFLLSKLKGVPKSRIYRIVRKGEVRVNKGRVDIKYRLQEGDIVRIPPIRLSESSTDTPVSVPQTLKNSLEKDILYEDEAMLVINKPSGYAVHGGSGLDSAVIEGLRAIRPESRFLELVHRLDKDTSGCLLIAKKRSALRGLHELFRSDNVHKTYLAILAGRWARKKLLVNAPLQKNVGVSGDRKVVISKSGKEAETLFRRVSVHQDMTLVEASPKTGRTHQIRVHAASMGHAIIGDEKYGDFELNKKFKKMGYKRMFLHAFKLEFKHPVTGKLIQIVAPMPKAMRDLVNNEEKF